LQSRPGLKLSQSFTVLAGGVKIKSHRAEKRGEKKGVPMQPHENVTRRLEILHLAYLIPLCLLKTDSKNFSRRNWKRGVALRKKKLGRDLCRWDNRRTRRTYWEVLQNFSCKVKQGKFPGTKIVRRRIEGKAERRDHKKKHVFKRVGEKTKVGKKRRGENPLTKPISSDFRKKKRSSPI